MAKRGPKGPSKYTEEFINKEAKALLEYTNKAIIPFIKEFAVERGYPSEEISRMSNKNENFSHTLKRMKDVQEIKLIKAGLSNKASTAFVIFTLKNVAGWRDKKELDIGGQKDNPVTTKEIKDMSVDELKQKINELTSK